MARPGMSRAWEEGKEAGDEVREKLRSTWTGAKGPGRGEAGWVLTV